MEDLIERLKYEIEHGESSLDIGMRVYGALRENGEREMATAFNDAYNDYANDDVQIDEELLQRVYDLLGSFPEPEPPEDPYANLGK